MYKIIYATFKFRYYFARKSCLIIYRGAPGYILKPWKILGFLSLRQFYAHTHHCIRLRLLFQKTGNVCTLFLPNIYYIKKKTGSIQTEFSFFDFCLFPVRRRNFKLYLTCFTYVIIPLILSVRPIKVKSLLSKFSLNFNAASLFRILIFSGKKK